MNRLDSPTGRFAQIQLLLLSQLEPMTQADIARRIGVHRANVGRMLEKMPDAGIPLDYDEQGRVSIRRDAYPNYLPLNLHEATALFLAGRLLARYGDKPNPHAVDALLKLGLALEKGVAPAVGRHIKHTSQALQARYSTEQVDYVKTLEIVTSAWAQGRKVEMSYRPLHSTRAFRHRFDPYFLEPSAIGYSTYLIGLDEALGQIRTRKLERIEQVSMLPEKFEVPASFDPLKLLSGAWGIWFDEEDQPTPVELRFGREVARRVQETVWHPSQKTTPDTETDGLIWRAQIDEPREMLPWIRGWGANVEVLKPEGLREDLVAESRKLARVYGITSVPVDPQLARALRCWGKTGKGDQDFHPALYHMLDVGHVAQVLLREPASVRWRRVLSGALGVNEDTLGEWLPWVVALHDVGKLSAPFQAQNAAQKARLIREQFEFGNWHTDIPHAIVSQTFLSDGLVAMQPAFADPWLQCVAEAIGGHHGHFQTGDAIRDARDALTLWEPSEWAALRAKAAGFLSTHLLQQPPALSVVPANASAVAAMLNGFVIVCDWLGSDSRFFTPCPDAEPSDYIRRSAAQAFRAVEAAGFLQPVLSDAPLLVGELFKDLSELRPLQRAVDDIPQDMLAAPCLAIIEAPTGEGKTETALSLAHRIAALRGTDELYYALPTMATSNQMFKRLQTHLRNRLHLPTAVKLIHGQALLIEDDLRIEPLDDIDVQGRNAAMEWFNPKKRALLAPFGIGTVDQAELAALNVRHTPLRLTGLAGKVVIVDEVHAYDTYMTTIIERLLVWLKAIGSSVILLSATLPLSRRTKLAQAFGVSSMNDMLNQRAYPSLIVASNSGEGERLHMATPAAWQPNRQLEVGAMHLNDEDVDAKALWLLDQVKVGGCACWITNTVDRAQKLFERIDQLAPSDVDRCLLHAQFPLDERKQHEEELGAKYGPKGQRPRRGIVIGTQVLEQSLDMDFDVMASDLAPIDLLLQRAGRMHRHDRDRPVAHLVPRLWVNTLLRAPEDTTSLKPDNIIYDEYLLRLTWRILCERKVITLPQDYRPLIEAVYDETEPAQDNPLWGVWDKLQAKQSKAWGAANTRLLPDPDPEELFCARAARMTFEEDENSAAWIVAQTRLGEESINVIPLELLDEHTCCGSDGVPVDIRKPASRDVQMQLLRRGLRISRYAAVQAIKANNGKLPALFTKSALLKGQFPLWLHAGQTILSTDKGGLQLVLDAKLGLVIRPVDKASKTDDVEE